jgi:protein arginine N-methyltransferase 1
MLRDAVRTSEYMRAIRDTVTPGSRVIDFGSGTGVLAIFAARCQAARVDAIERESIVDKAREIARLSGCEDIRFHRADHHSFETDSLADVIVSEWMGHCLFLESMLEPLIALRDRWLKPSGVMLPARVSVSAALVVDDSFYEEDSFLEGKPYGIDFGPIADLPLLQSRLVTIDEDQLLGPACDLGSLDMKTVTRTPERLEGTLTVEREARAFGLVAWFDAFLTETIRLGTGPHDAPTHWRPVYFPFPAPIEVSPARPLAISLCPPRAVEETEAAWRWSVSDGETSLLVDERETFARTAPSAPARSESPPG